MNDIEMVGRTFAHLLIECILEIYMKWSLTRSSYLLCTYIFSLVLDFSGKIAKLDNYRVCWILCHFCGLFKDNFFGFGRFALPHFDLPTTCSNDDSLARLSSSYSFMKLIDF